MRTAIVLLLFLTELCFSQGTQCVGIRSPSINSDYNTFDETKIASLVPTCWFKSTVGVYTNGTTVPSDGGAIFQWRDQSGNNYHLGQSSTVTLRPIYSISSNTLNGYPSVWFWDKRGMTNGGWTLKKPPYTMFAVFKNMVPYANSYLWRNGGLCYLDGDNILHLGNSGPTYTGFATNVWSVVSATCVSNVSRIQSVTNSCLYLQSKKVITNPTANPAFESSSFAISASGDSGGIYGGFIEVIFFNYYMTESNRKGVELYLKRKYAIQSAF